MVGLQECRLSTHPALPPQHARGEGYAQSAARQVDNPVYSATCAFRGAGGPSAKCLESRGELGPRSGR